MVDFEIYTVRDIVLFYCFLTLRSKDKRSYIAKQIVLLSLHLAISLSSFFFLFTVYLVVSLLLSYWFFFSPLFSLFLLHDQDLLPSASLDVLVVFSCVCVFWKNKNKLKGKKKQTPFCRVGFAKTKKAVALDQIRPFLTILRHESESFLFRKIMRPQQLWNISFGKSFCFIRMVGLV